MGIWAVVDQIANTFKDTILELLELGLGVSVHTISLMLPAKAMSGHSTAHNAHRY
jgi:hypothetical protein